MCVLALGPAAAIACGGSVAGSEIDPYVSASSSSSSSTSSGNTSGSTSGYSSSSSSGTITLKEPKVHRAVATACDTTRANSPVSAPDAGIGGGGYVQCTSHEQCTEGKNGRCTGNGHDGWRCNYDGCFADGECGKGSVCACEGGFRSDNNVCLAEGCQVDADCGAGSWCSPTLGSCGHYSKAESYQCHTAADECTDDTDCTENGSGPFGGQAYCAFDRVIGHWKCSNSECAG